MAITVQGVTLPYSGLFIEHWQAPAAGVYAVMGPNGAGKSQWLSLLAGQLKVRGGTVKRGRHRIGLVMQHPEHQIAEDRVSAEMLWPYGETRRTAPDFLASVAQVRTRWALDGFWDDSPWTLSTGQKRRLVFAVYDLLNPDVLLLDEPSEALDGEWKDRTRRWVAERAQDHLVLIASHDWPWVLSFVDQGYWCEGTLDNKPRDLGELWYERQVPPSGRLEELWRELLDRSAPVGLREWIDPQIAAGQAVKLWHWKHGAR